MIAARRTALVGAIGLAAMAAAVPVTAHAAGAASPVRGFSVSPEAFSPRAVAAPRSATIVFTLTGATPAGSKTGGGKAPAKARSASKVTLQILGGSAKVVRTLADWPAAAPKTYRVRWDGRSADKSRAPDGAYRVRLVIVRAKKRTTVYRAVRLDATAPRLASLGAAPDPFWPAGGDATGTLQVTVRVERERVRLITTVVGPSGLALRWTDVVSGTVRHSWDGRVGGRIVGYGVLTIKATARDAVGNESALVRVVRVSPYSDLGSVPEALRDAILEAVRRHIAVPRGGLFSGGPGGSFKPTAGATRADLAGALARAFGPRSDTSTSARAAGRPAGRPFSDIPTGTPLEEAAALAVARGWMESYATTETTGAEQFRPGATATTAQVARALTRALGMRTAAEKVASQDTDTPWWGGDTVVMQDLGLRRHGANVHPLAAYPRGEVAYSLVEALKVDRASRSRVSGMFADAKRIAQSARQRQFTLGARRFLGEPYVWGGDALSEGGFDCSGLLYHVAGKLRVSLRRTAAEQCADSRFPAVSFAALAPGDGIYFRSTTGGRISHAGMYLGDGYFIHSSGSRNGVSIDRLVAGSYWRDHLAWGRRYIPTVEIRDPSVSPPAFSPNGDGKKDVATIAFRTTKEATVSVAVDDASGGRVRTLVSARRPAGRFTFGWDGMATGRAAADGRYIVRVRAVDDELNRRAYQTWVTLDTSAPALADPSMSPDPYDASETTATLSVRVSQPCSVTLVVEKSDGAGVLSTTTAATASGTVRFAWKGRAADGRAAPPGTYRFRFVAVDAAANPAETRYRTFELK